MIYIYSIGPQEKKYTEDDIYTYVDDRATVDAVSGIADDGDGSDIIGILTGRRFFVRNDQPLIAPYIKRIMDRFDLILPYEAGRRFEPGAMIMRRGLLKEFILSIPENIAMIDDARVPGLLKEFVLSRHLHVKGESTSRSDPDIWNMGHQRIGAVSRYIDTLLGDYIELRRTTGFEESFAEEDPYKGDFDGKNPVWMCWWQGIDTAPDLVKACIASVKNNLPGNAEVIMITSENYTDYVTLTPVILDKFSRGLIGFTHLSDAIRVELMFRYGGMWIDATNYFSHRIPDAFPGQDLFSSAFVPPLWGMDIQRGRWNSSLISARKAHPAVQFLMEGLWLYWERADELVDYFVFDYICDAGYRHIAEIKEAIDAIPPSSPAVYDLQLMMNHRISESGRKWLEEASLYYKLNRRNKYTAVTPHGFMTFYGYITGHENRESRSDVPVIECKTGQDLVESIREVNPDRIIDMDGYYEKEGRISRGVLDDIILHDLIIELARTQDENGTSEGTGGFTSPVYDEEVTDVSSDGAVAEIRLDPGYRFVCY